MKTDMTFRGTISRPLTPTEVDANFNRVMYFSGAWAGGQVYEVNEVVTHLGGLYVCNTNTNGDPSVSSDWTSIGGSGGGASLPAAGVASVNIHNYSNITSSWSAINLWDSAIGAQSEGITVSTGGVITLDSTGWYEIRFDALMDYTSFSADRDIGFRMFNISDSTVYTQQQFHLPINSSTAKVSVSTAANVTADPSAQTFRCEWAVISGTDIVSPSYTSAQLMVRKISNA